MESSRKKQSRVVRWVEQSIAVALISLAAAPVAFAADGGGGATASAGAKTSVAKTLVKLKKQVTALQQQVTALQGRTGDDGRAGEQKPTDSRPTGPAGGDLTGAFPNPLIGPNTIGALEIQDNAVGAGEILDNGVGAAELQDNSVGVLELQNNAIGSTQKIAENAVAAPDILEGAVGDSELAIESVSSVKIDDNGVGSVDLGGESVGGLELKPVTARVGQGVGVSKSGGPAEAKVTCPGNERLLNGGYAWQQDEANSIIASAPSELEPSHTWVVRGMVPEGSNTLYAWATCITP